MISFKRARSPSIFCTVYFLDFTQLGIVWPVAYFVAELFTLTVLPSAIEPFDLLALDMYNDERLAHYIIEYNPDYCDVIVFEGGVQLKLPVVEEAETSETVPPWRATA